MILKAKERGGGAQLARYLLSMRDNDHVDLHEVRGFVSDDLISAFNETDAIARGTRCKNYLFSTSLNPPQGEQVEIEAFERAVDEIERKLGLKDQPRAIVFHEKDGRRHAHVVWSRIDAARMRAINLPHYKLKLKELSRNLFREHGWEMPKGLRDWRERDPLRYSHAEWQQARRIGLDPRQVKALFKECWAASDNCESFAQALNERGFWLARGDRRGFVALDYKGNVHAVTKRAGVKTKDVEAKLGDPSSLPSVAEVKAEIAQRMTKTLESYIRDIERDAKRPSPSIEFKRSEMQGRHRQERKTLSDVHEKRRIAETNARAARLAKGFKGIWHRITGRHSKIKARNEREAWQAHLRDRSETENLIVSHLEERERLQSQINEQRESQQAELLQLRSDVAQYQGLEPCTHRERERDDHHQEERSERRRRSRSRRRSRDRGPEPH